MFNPVLAKFKLPTEILDIINHENVLVPESREQLVKLAIGGQQSGFYEVAYQVADRGRVLEATVTRCKNGVSVNYVEPYMRRRDPDCMVIGDDKPTDKETYKQRFGESFDSVRLQTLEWLRQQSLIVMPFMAGGMDYGYPALLIAPRNAAFFAAALADLQELVRGIKFTMSLRQGESYTWHRHFAIPILTANKWWFTTVRRLHEVFSYNPIQAPVPRKVFTVCCWTSERRKVGRLCMLLPSRSSHLMKIS